MGLDKHQGNLGNVATNVLRENWHNQVQKSIDLNRILTELGSILEWGLDIATVETTLEPWL